MRLNSRITNANLPYNTRFPIILPQCHQFVDFLVRKVHFELAHFGWSYVLAKIQNRFWILHGQSVVRSYLKNCVFFCQLRNVESSTQFMAALPKERLVSGEHAFFSTRCDMFGLFFVTDLRKR